MLAATLKLKMVIPSIQRNASGIEHNLLVLGTACVVSAMTGYDHEEMLGN